MPCFIIKSLGFTDTSQWDFIPPFPPGGEGNRDSERGTVPDVSLAVNELRARTLKLSMLSISIINSSTVEAVFLIAYSYEALD